MIFLIECGKFWLGHCRTGRTASDGQDADADADYADQKVKFFLKAQKTYNVGGIS